MTSKINDIAAIRRYLNEIHDLYGAVAIWCESYHPISVKEFLECSYYQNSNEILVTLNEKIMMLTLARDEINEYLRCGTQNEQD